MDALICNIYLWIKILHVSDSFSVHHHEFFFFPCPTIRSFFTVHTTMVYVITIAVCTVKKLLMMDRGTVRNM